ncbi:unnamed protein product [Lupinus luteus]|uniref:Amino acid transporter transmembrane domain-containing protein n=1 Tax=Lupinus luteus TaxID=3873 RepID=A0AAV1XQ33_LUPLU
MSDDALAKQKAIDDWFPITASRKAKWWYSAIHNVTAMVGAGVLSLPYAMSNMGCIQLLLCIGRCCICLCWSQCGFGNPSNNAFNTRKPIKETNVERSFVAYIGVAFCYFPVAFIGYYMFGNSVDDNILMSLERPGWLIAAANLFVVVHVVGGYQIFAMSVFDMMETYMVIKLKFATSFRLRLISHSIYVASLYHMAQTQKTQEIQSRLGFLIDFLSHAAIVGFMAGVAVTIALQQLKGLLGMVKFTKKTDIVSVMRSVWGTVHHGAKKRKKLFWVAVIAKIRRNSSPITWNLGKGGTQKVTPEIYLQLVAAVNESYALEHHTPLLLSLQNCNFVRYTFTRIISSYCPLLNHYLKIINAGLGLISVAVLLCLVLWILYANRSGSEEDVCYKDVFIASFAAVAVDKVGRKLSMSIMFFMCCIFPLPLIFHLPKGLTTGLLFRARICITTTFTIMYIYAPEIYPTSVRTTGMGTASSMARIGGIFPV